MFGEEGQTAARGRSKGKFMLLLSFCDACDSWGKCLLLSQEDVQHLLKAPYSSPPYCSSQTPVEQFPVPECLSIYCWLSGVRRRWSVSLASNTGVFTENTQDRPSRATMVKDKRNGSKRSKVIQCNAPWWPSINLSPESEIKRFKIHRWVGSLYWPQSLLGFVQTWSKMLGMEIWVWFLCSCCAFVCCCPSY